MSILKLDRDQKYGVVYGHATKKYYQGGVYFDGTECALGGTATKKPKPVPVNEPAHVVELAGDNKAARIKELNKVSVPRLKKLATKVHESTGAKLPKMKGTGVKARLVKYLADNTL